MGCRLRRRGQDSRRPRRFALGGQQLIPDLPENRIDLDPVSGICRRHRRRCQRCDLGRRHQCTARWLRGLRVDRRRVGGGLGRRGQNRRRGGRESLGSQLKRTNLSPDRIGLVPISRLGIRHWRKRERLSMDCRNRTASPVASGSTSGPESAGPPSPAEQKRSQSIQTGPHG